jgi:CelD/BcsL family acetyltransferase involved in cellulose biosynthesis
LAQGQGVVVLARLGKEPVAGAVYFRFQKTVTYKYGASDDSFQQLRGNNLVMWEAIKHHARAGFETMDFGRTSLDNSGLRRFKLGWGATERPVDYVRMNLRSGAFTSTKDATSGMHTRIFKFLPERLSGLIGALFYNHAA